MSPIDLNLKPEEQEEARERVVKAVSIPNGSLCRNLVYDIDFSKKVKEESAKLRTKPDLLQGLVLRFVTLSYFEGPSEKIIVDYSNPEEIKLPLGETGMKSIAWFGGAQESWCRIHKLVTPQNVKDARQNFNVWLEKEYGIPMEFEKGTQGILFTAFRNWKIKEKDGQRSVEVRLSIYDKDAKKFLEPDVINPEYLDASVTASIWAAIDPDKKANDAVPF